MVDQCGLSDSSPGNYCNDIYIRVCPCIIQEGNIFLSTKNIASCDGTRQNLPVPALLAACELRENFSAWVIVGSAFTVQPASENAAWDLYRGTSMRLTTDCGTPWSFSSGNERADVDSAGFQTAHGLSTFPKRNTKRESPNGYPPSE
jgi:hypothetical protein